jgi:hypothetical protein
MIWNDELALHFFGKDGEFLKFDYREDLRWILCPTQNQATSQGLLLGKDF